MPRPQLTDETYDRLCSLVDDRTRVPAEHLTTEKKLVFLLDTLEETETRTARLADRVEELEDELDAARAAGSDDGSGRADASEIATADLPEEIANNLGGNTRRRR